MKFKRFMALALAGVMTLGMSMNVLAEDKDKPLDDSVVLITKDLAYETAGVDSVNQTFTFTFTQDEQVEGQPENMYSAPIANKTATFTDATQKQIKLTSSEIEAFKAHPGVYTYAVAETTEADPTDGFGVFYDTTKENNNKYKLNVFVKKGAQENTVSYYLVKVVDGKEVKDEKIAYKNMFRPKAGPNGSDVSLEISKEVVNPEWATIDEYTFTITFTDGEAVYTDGETEATIAKVNANGYTAVKGEENLTIKSGDSFKLKNGEKIQFKNIPAGIKYTVTETKDPAQASCEVAVNGGDKATGEIVENQVLKAGSANTAAFTNTYKPIDMTGVAINVAPFAVMLAAVAGAVILYVAAKRRVR